MNRLAGGGSEQKYEGPAPSPFEHPAVQVEVEKLAVEALRPLVGDQVGKAYQDYMAAINKVRGTLGETEKAEKAKSEELWTLALTVALIPVGGSVLTGLASQVAAHAAGPVVQAKLLRSVESNAPRLLMAAGINDARLSTAMANSVYETVASDTMTRLATKFSAEKAASTVTDAVEKLKGITAKLAVGGNKYALGRSYLKALESAASGAQNNMLLAIHGASTYDQLVGLYETFRSVTIDVYEAQIQQQTDNFMEELAPVLHSKQSEKTGGGTGDEIVWINAYGKPRLAHVQRSTPEAANFLFHGWVTPDMEAMALAAIKNPQTLPAEMVLGHLPRPDRQDAKERIVRMDAWGRMRMAAVEIDDGEMKFTRWITEDETPAAEAKGALQINGIDQVDPAHVKKLKKPE